MQYSSLLYRFMLTLALGFMLLSPARAQQAAPAQGQSAAESQVSADSVDAFVRLIENDASRAALISRLRAKAGDAVTPPPAPAQTAETTIAGQIAEYTRAAAENVADAFGSLFALADNIGGVFADAAHADLSGLRQILLPVLLVGFGLAVVFYGFGLIVERTTAPLVRRAVGAGPFRRAMLLLAVTLIDALRIVVAWLGGYLIALLLIGGATGRMEISQTLLLNAFLLSQTTHLVMRAVLCHRRSALRFLRIDDTTAAYWYIWLARIVTVLAYGFTFLAPLLNKSLSADAAQAVRILTVLVAVVIGAALILQNRLKVKQALQAPAVAGRTDTLARLGAAFSHVWHVVALAYMLALALAWLVNPLQALPFLLSATWRSALTLVVGAVVIALVRRLVSVGTRVPEDLRERLPLLESRLNAFLPRILQVVRLVVLVVVVAAIADIWGVAHFDRWFASDVGRRVVASIFSAGLVLLMGMVVYLILASWVEYRLNPNYGAVPTPRERTLLALFRNAVTIALTVLVVMLMLAQLGVNIAPLLAGAGVLGLAIGFGSQELVKDIITGVFIQFENAMNTGDVVTVAGKTGVVEKLTIRSVSIREGDGTLNVIPFSKVDAVANKLKDFSFFMLDIGIAYRESVPDAKQAMRDAFEKLKAMPEHVPNIIGDLEIWGVTSFGASSVNIGGRIRSPAGKQWGVGRAYNEILKEVFDERGIEMPYPHMTVYMGEDKNGYAPPLNIRRAPARPLPVAAPVPEGEEVVPDGSFPAADEVSASEDRGDEASRPPGKM